MDKIISYSQGQVKLFVSGFWKMGMTWKVKWKGKDILVGNDGMAGHTEA